MKFPDLMTGTPEEITNFGLALFSEEFNLHLDRASDHSMGMFAWQMHKAAKYVEGMAAQMLVNEMGKHVSFNGTEVQRKAWTSWERAYVKKKKYIMRCNEFNMLVRIAHECGFEIPEGLVL